MMYGLGLGASMGGIFMIAIVGLVVWAIVSAVRPERTAAPSSTPRALEVLADRYARGEIDGEEYRNTKAAIEGSI
jgi:putative membrane protein